MKLAEAIQAQTPLVQRLLPLTQLDPFLPPQLANWRQRASSHSRRWFVATLSVSTAAWIGSLPFILGHFQSVTPVAVIANEASSLAIASGDAFSRIVSSV